MDKKSKSMIRPIPVHSYRRRPRRQSTGNRAWLHSAAQSLQPSPETPQHHSFPPSCHAPSLTASPPVALPFKAPLRRRRLPHPLHSLTPRPRWSQPLPLVANMAAIFILHLTSPPHPTTNLLRPPWSPSPPLNPSPYRRQHQSPQNRPPCSSLLPPASPPPSIFL